MQRKNYPVDKDLFSTEWIDPHAIEIIERLQEAGHSAYLVGGSVRDILLKQKPKDFDISTSAKPEEIKRLFRNCILIGRRFRLAHIRFGQKVFEVSTFRSGSIESESLIVRDNEWGSPEEDALRRDFTINALFYDHSSKSIIDYVDGYPDIQKKYLRTIGLPFLRFKQDPVRMIRLLKFQARFGFEVDPDTHVGLLECRSEILKSAPARLLEELLRMLESGSARMFFKLMLEHGFIQHLLPMLGDFMNTPEGDEISSYLQEIDILVSSNDVCLDRSVLLSCLFFPMLQKRIDDRYVSRGKHLHLGNIQSETFTLIDEVCQFFFHLPRRIRGIVASILVSQYRLTPIEKKRTKKIRVPNDPSFLLALEFLQIRACLEPGLQMIWDEWNGAYSQTGSTQPKRRRKRRRKGGKPSSVKETT